MQNREDLEEDLDSMSYPCMVDQVAAELSYVLEHSHIVLHTVLPELTGRELLLQHTRCTCETEKRFGLLFLSAPNIINPTLTYQQPRNHIHKEMCMKQSYILMEIRL